MIRAFKETLVYSWSFHDPNRKISDKIIFEQYCKHVLSFETSYGLAPTMVGVNGDGYSRNEIVSFEKGFKLLEENDFGNIESLSLYTKAPEQLDFAFYWKIFASFSISKILGAHLYLGFAFDLLNNKEKIIHGLVEPLANRLNPQYGYAHFSTAEQGPFGYSAGFVHIPDGSVMSESQKQAIAKWAINADLISEGKLRDLYQMNVLSDLQLGSRIDGYFLKDWISADSKRGILSPFGGTLYLWTVPIDSYHPIREKLAGNELLIAYDKNVLPTILVSN